MCLYFLCAKCVYAMCPGGVSRRVCGVAYVQWEWPGWRRARARVARVARRVPRVCLTPSHRVAVPVGKIRLLAERTVHTVHTAGATIVWVPF